MGKQISEDRKKLYNAGLIMMIAGGCLFAGPFIAGPISIMTDTIDSGIIPFVFLLAFIGFGLIVGGAAMRTVAARGKAGSGLVLDPEQAREDLRPWTGLAGGMVKDTLHEADISLGAAPSQVVMIRCRNCQKLNEEDSKFCRECGKPL